ncbi:hypothetical protein, partial [Nocardia sp. NPDC004750]
NSSGYGFGMGDILPARSNPHRSGVNQTEGSPNHVNGQIAKTVEPTVIVDNGVIVTAFPGGKCRA